jgi:hypothetical protein
MRYPPAAWLFIGFLTGCAHASIPHTSPGPDANRSSSASSVVTSVELARAAQRGNLMAALQQIRPSFLTARGGTLLVSVDGVVFADASVLRYISVTDVCEVRLQRGTSAPSVPSVVLPNGGVSSGGDLIDVSLRHDATTPCPRQ